MNIHKSTHVTRLIMEELLQFLSKNTTFKLYFITLKGIKNYVEDKLKFALSNLHFVRNIHILHHPARKKKQFF